LAGFLHVFFIQQLRIFIQKYNRVLAIMPGSKVLVDAAMAMHEHIPFMV
jgi:hypothetical protein